MRNDMACILPKILGDIPRSFIGKAIAGIVIEKTSDLSLSDLYNFAIFICPDWCRN